MSNLMLITKMNKNDLKIFMEKMMIFMCVRKAIEVVMSKDDYSQPMLLVTSI